MDSKSELLSPFQALYEAVQTRPRPEDVADLIEQRLAMTEPELRIIQTASRGSLRRHMYAYSSMALDFLRPVSAEKAARTAATLFSKDGKPVPTLTVEQCSDPEAITAYVSALGEIIGKTFGEYRHLNKKERHARGLFKCQRWYNKRYRVLCRLEAKIKSLAWNTRRYEFTRVGKSGLATKIPRTDFDANLTTACFVAYHSARMSKRSVFTNESQERAFDEISSMLLAKVEADPGARWDVVAHVLVEPRVLRHLYEGDRGKLLGTWWTLLSDMAAMLQEIATKQSFDRKAMIVSRGNDSSTWNQVASGWNQARSNWISLLYALGLEGLLDEVCPGKVMRLMAADVAYWHKASGKDVHPDTLVWADLPPPWEVVSGAVRCTRTTVERACLAHGVEPEAWTGCKKNQTPAPFKPTPELVHGVAVSCPGLALALRKGGVFSGKPMKDGVELPPFEIERTPEGFATGAHRGGV